MMRAILWIVLTVSLLPYLYARTGYRLYAYALAVMLAMWTTSVFLLSSQVRRLALHVARQSPHFLLYCGFILISQSISLFRTPELDIYGYVWGLGYIVVGLTSYFVFPVVIGSSSFRPWLAFLIVVGTISSVIGVYVAFTSATEVLGLHIRQVQPYTPLGIYTTSSIFYESNRFAISAFFGWLGSLYFLLKRKRIPLFAVTLLLCFAGVIVSWSRATYLGLAFAFSIWLLSITKASRRRRAVALLFLLAISWVLMVIYIKPVNEALFGLGLSRREILWPAAIKLIAKRPLFGYGFGSAEIVQNRLYAYTGFATSVHSTPLGIAFHTGIPAAVMYLITFWVSLRRLLYSKLYRPEKAIIMAGTIGSFVAALFLDYTPGGIAYGTFVYTTFLGLANASPWLQPVGSRRVRGLTERGGAN